MPELPEIEVLRRSLEPLLLGERIEGSRVRNPALREPVDSRRLGRMVRGRAIRKLRRRAKYLLIDLEGGRTLVVHLGMSGRLTLIAGDAPVLPHEHVSFRLTGGSRLAFRDARRFGLVLVLPTPGLESDRHFASLGLEPLGQEISGET
ncbi:MAG: DNA-formamidopyrimidine glycosylase family protein, partial [Thermoanaerobaculia bacterium]